MQHTEVRGEQVLGMSYLSRAPDQEEAFRALYQSAYADLLKFVQRRTDAAHAEDVVAEAFLIVWRRFSETPQHEDDARAWIFGITRNLMLNARRGEQRRHALGVRLADATSVSNADSHADLVSSRVDLGRAWELLSAIHQEALGLAIFENLAAPQAARVLGISPVAFRLRLTRARRALRLLLDHIPRQESPAPATSSEKATTP
ncbi:sigma-70 family RNA polymerase sigma factor [Paenarthrobacter sp. TYUT067]|uniref:RNA polymerase sigma factor n=1 Tax=Paenarthrobacter sp. TYUT067 TaxID=2926245 RepID=UPI00202FB493|nr:sigma-70 family RNA polymerase sigma factor [Paenarthrobacter sp. TYUT067]MCM0616173.1 sigma-70 family RNA polymerase sigma factor [Paenarthrobacter sp. TYUT067]